MRGAAAVVRYLTLAHRRSPLLLLAPALFTIVLSAMPSVGEPGSATRMRAASALALGSGTLVLILLAVVLPLASVPLGRRSSPFAVLSAPGRQAACVLGHGLILLVSAALLAAITIGIGTLSFGSEAYFEGKVVREVLATGPLTGFDLGPDRRDHPVTFDLDPERHGSTHLRVRLAPRLHAEPGEFSLRGGSLEAPLEILYRAGGSTRWRLREAAFRFGLPATVGLDLEPNARSPLELLLRRSGPGFRMEFPPGSIALGGAPASLPATVLRGFLILALAAWPVLTVCLWFSRIVAYPLAVAAALTLALVAAVAVPWLPGGTFVDPSERITVGDALGWGDLLVPALVALGWTVVIAAIAVRDDRVLERGT